jgi:hypothetical protein
MKILGTKVMKAELAKNIGGFGAPENKIHNIDAIITIID